MVEIVLIGLADGEKKRGGGAEHCKLKIFLESLILCNGVEWKAGEYLIALDAFGKRLSKSN